MDLNLLLLLLTAHFIGDFYLQPTFWVQCRNKYHYKSRGLWLHFATHLALNIGVFVLLSQPLGLAIMAIATISLSHLLTDLWKSYRPGTLFYFLLDQVIHLLIITAVWAYLSGLTAADLSTFVTSMMAPDNLVILMAYLLAFKPSSVIISLALKRLTDQISSLTSQNEAEFGLSSAGAWIGYIERSLAISFILMGQFSAIGFLIAAKTIFRFGDLTNSKDMKLTEYMMLGTLFSYAIALLLGWHALKLYQVL